MTQREEFEAWLKNPCHINSVSDENEWAWMVWQAAQAAQPVVLGNYRSGPWTGVPPNPTLHPVWPAGAGLGRVIPEGWKLVPVEPTEAMLMCLTPGDQPLERWAAYYREMLAAAPSTNEQNNG